MQRVARERSGVVVDVDAVVVEERSQVGGGWSGDDDCRTTSRWEGLSRVDGQKTQSKMNRKACSCRRDTQESMSTGYRNEVSLWSSTWDRLVLVGERMSMLVSAGPKLYCYGVEESRSVKVVKQPSVTG